MTALRIGALARRTGASPPTIRYYEEIGLIPPARRAGAQRVYDEDDVKRLTFIRRCRDFGFGLEQVRTLVALVQDRERSCFDARDLAAARLADVRAQLAELRALEADIADFVATCDRDCAGGPGAECAVLEDLAQPAAPTGRALTPGRAGRTGSPRRRRGR